MRKDFKSLSDTNFVAALFILLVLVAGMINPVLAQTTDPWGSFSNLLITWITGNLGKTITLVGILISVIAAVAMQSFKPLIYGVILSVFIGGLVGFARMFFEAGAAAFGTNW